jgi:D-mannonate dehydratase
MIIKNFLTKEECEVLIEEAKTSTNWKPQNKDTGIYILPSKNHKIMIDINKKVSELFDKNLHTQMIRMIHKTDSNSFWEDHSDNSGGSNIKYGVVIYLNDDFQGGELFYTESKMIIKPEKGMLIYHAGDKVHGVSKVDSGIRYTLTSFIRGKVEIDTADGLGV